MDFIEKTKVRLEYWISHNDHHQKDYEQLSEELEKLGKNEAAQSIREVVDCTKKITESFSKALSSLK